MLSFFFYMIKINSLIPASMHSSSICSKFDFPFIGSSSFGVMLERGRSLVPSPAKGIIACFTISFFYFQISIITNENI